MQKHTKTREIAGPEEARDRVRASRQAAGAEPSARWIVLPYDGSPVARAALGRAARAVRQGGRLWPYAGVVLATAGVDPSSLDTMADEARRLAGPDVPLDARLLLPGDPVGALRRMADALPGSILAAPIGGRGWAPWYTAACRLDGDARTTMLFLIRRDEIRTFEGAGRSNAAGEALAALRHAGAHLANSVRSLFAGRNRSLGSGG